MCGIVIMSSSLRELAVWFFMAAIGAIGAGVAFIGTGQWQAVQLFGVLCVGLALLMLPVIGVVRLTGLILTNAQAALLVGLIAAIACVLAILLTGSELGRSIAAFASF
jgi:hypothetical protein